MKQKNIIIIGAGIVGVMTARFLQKEGHNITIIDKDIPGNGCSFGNAGYIATDEVWPLARPDTLLGVPKMLLNPMAPLTIRYKDFFHLVPWFLKFTWACRPSQVKIGTKALSNLFNYTDKIWREEFTSLGRTDLFADQGVLKVFENDNIFKKNERERQIQLECGVNLRVLSGHEAREKVPELSNNIKKAIFFKKGLKVTHPFDLTKALVKDFINTGGTLIHDKVTNLETINDKIINDKIINDKIINYKILNDKILNDKLLNDKIINDQIINENDKIINDKIINDKIKVAKLYTVK